MSATLETLEPTTADSDQAKSNQPANRQTPPTSHPQHLPFVAILWSLLLLGAFAVWTHYAGGPMLYHLVVGGALLYSVSRLLALESKPNKISGSEIICAVCIAITGGLLFTSPAIQPFVQDALRFAKVFPSVKFEDGPTKEMYEIKEGKILPTPAVTSEFELIVGFDKEVSEDGKTTKFKTMRSVTQKGVKIDKKDAEIWLQKRATGATSNSIAVEYPATSEAAETKEDSKTPAEKPTVKESDTAPIGTEPPKSTPDEASPKTDSPPADTGTEKPKTDDPDSTEPGSARA